METSFIAVTAYQSDDVSKNNQSYQSLFMLLFSTIIHYSHCHLSNFYLVSCPLYNCIFFPQVAHLKIRSNPYARAYRGGQKAGGHFKKRTRTSS